MHLAADEHGAPGFISPRTDTDPSDSSRPGRTRIHLLAVRDTECRTVLAADQRRRRWPACSRAQSASRPPKAPAGAKRLGAIEHGGTIWPRRRRQISDGSRWRSRVDAVITHGREATTNDRRGAIPPGSGQWTTGRWTLPAPTRFAQRPQAINRGHFYFVKNGDISISL